MHPDKTTVTGLFGNPHQYQVPVFQRGYVWTLEKQVGPLWSDLHDRAEEVIAQKALVAQGAQGQLKPIQKHFLGSIVVTPVPNAFGRVPAFEVIDGQQRSTTLHLLLLAFRHAATLIPGSPVPSMIEGLVRNRGPYQREEDYFKVWPTQAGQDDMRRLSDSATTIQDICTAYPARDGRKKVERPLMVQSFLYLYHACLAFLRGVDLNDPSGAAGDSTWSDKLIGEIRRSNDIEPIQGLLPLAADRAEALYMALNDHVQIMTLRLDLEDDPQVIFETLNARGEPLLASDLIRNFVFLEAARQGQDVQRLYGKHWSQFDLEGAGKKGVTANAYWREKERQGRLTYPRIDLFFFNYAVLRSREVTLASHVFQSFKSWWQKRPRDLEVELGRIVSSSVHFRELVSPEGTGHVAEFARLIKSLDVGTVVPVYLALRERLAVDSVELRQALCDLASYLTRRTVCGLTTKGYNRFFLKVLQAVCSDGEPPHIALRRTLSAATASSELWPDDAAFEDNWKVRQAYTELRPAKACGILRALEYAARGSRQASNHVPTQSELTVEHVLPQAWANEPAYQMPGMTDAQRVTREVMIQTFGNLTLLTQSLNSSAGKLPFSGTASAKGSATPSKQTRLLQSALLINTWFQRAGLTDWNEEAIAARSRSMTKAALLVWPRGGDGNPSPIAVAAALAGTG